MAEHFDGKYTVVEGQNTEFDADKGNVVEVTEDVVALLRHQPTNIVWGSRLRTFRTIVRSAGATAITCRPIPCGGPTIINLDVCVLAAVEVLTHQNQDRMRTVRRDISKCMSTESSRTDSSDILSQK